MRDSPTNPRAAGSALKRLSMAVSGGTLLAGAILGGPLARADVTVQQKTTMSVSGINIDMTSTERTSKDKQRSDTETRCHGFLALFCHDVQSAEIVRLDKQLEWHLQPKKKLYTEDAFPTAAERAQAQQKAQEMLDQLKKCPLPQGAPAAQPTPDTSQCQPLSQVDVKPTDEHATLAGHDTHRTSIVLSQTCTMPKTGDVCEIDYGFDVWSTTEEVAGSTERTAFTRDYLAAMGLDPNNSQVRGMMQQFLAPYADSLKQLRNKSGDLKGYPLRTSFYVAFGGPRCGQVHQAQAQQAQVAPARKRHGLLGGLASNAVSGGLGGLFHRNVNIGTGSVGGQVAANAADQTATAATDAAASAAGDAAANAGASHDKDQNAGPVVSGDKVRMIALTTETTSIDTSAIPSDLFDLPAGWRLQPPPPRNAKEDQFSCPAAGN